MLRPRARDSQTAAVVPTEQPPVPVAGGTISLLPKHSSVQVEEYVAILNSLDSRRGKKPLDVNNVIYWFKNTRAAVKRAQVG